MVVDIDAKFVVFDIVVVLLLLLQLLLNVQDIAIVGGEDEVGKGDKEEIGVSKNLRYDKYT